MICPKCGRTIPDGTQCPCSAGTPVLSSNPALNVIKTIGSSPLFLALAVLYSVTTLLSIIVSMGGQEILNYAYYYAANAGVDTSFLYPFLDVMESTSVVGSVLSAIPAILIAVSLWLHFGTSKNTASGNISTAGLTICKVLAYVSLIFVCIICALAAVMLIIVMAAGDIHYTYNGYAVDPTPGYFAILIVMLVLMAAFLALYIAYEICVIRVINRIKATAMSGIPDNRIPNYLIVMNYIFAVFSGLAAVTSLFRSPLTALGSLASAACMVLVSVCLTRYRSQMTMLLYPPVQPVYAAPPVPPYGQPQAPVQSCVPQYPAEQLYAQPPQPVQQPQVPAAPAPVEPAQSYVRQPQEPAVPESAPVPPAEAPEEEKPE